MTPQANLFGARWNKSLLLFVTHLVELWSRAVTEWQHPHGAQLLSSVPTQQRPSGFQPLEPHGWCRRAALPGFFHVGLTATPATEVGHWEQRHPPPSRAASPGRPLGPRAAQCLAASPPSRLVQRWGFCDRLGSGYVGHASSWAPQSGSCILVLLHGLNEG